MSYDIDRLADDESSYRIQAFPGEEIGFLFASMDESWIITNKVIGLESPVVQKGCLSGTAIADSWGYTNWYQNYNLKEKLSDGSEIVDNAVTSVSFSFEKESTTGEKQLLKTVVFSINYGPIPEEPEIDPNAPVYVTESNMDSLFEITTYAADLNHFEVVNMGILTQYQAQMTVKAAAYDKMGILFYSESPDDDVSIPQLTEDEQQLLKDQSKYILGLEDKGKRYWFFAYQASRSNIGKLEIDVPIVVSSSAAQSAGALEFTYKITIEVGDTTQTGAIDLTVDQAEATPVVSASRPTVGQSDVEEVTDANSFFSDLNAGFYEGKEWYKEPAAEAGKAPEPACRDTNEKAKDGSGETCEWYESNPEWCGKYDTNEFNALLMCCVCSWEFAKDAAASNYVKPDDCDNTDFGVFTDLYGSGCDFYEKYPKFCGAYDDDDFVAKDMCCICNPDHGSELANGAKFVTIKVDPFAEAQAEKLAEKEAATASSGETETSKKPSKGPIDYNNLETLNEEGWENLIKDELFGETSAAANPTMDWTELSSSLDGFIDLREQAKGANVVCENYDIDPETGVQVFDSMGNGCKLYADYPASCGGLDTDAFGAFDLCCACGGGSTASQKSCDDIVNLLDDGVTEAKDASGFGCEWYNVNPQDCEVAEFNDVGFIASEQCCACGGGNGDYYDPWNAEVSSLADIREKADNKGDIALAILNNPLQVIGGFFGTKEVTDEFAAPAN